MGVPVSLHYSVAVALPFFAWLAASRMRAPVMLASLAGSALATPWAWGGLLACGLVAALALHELAHVAAARLLGGRVRSITLMLLGGCGPLDGVSGASAQVAVALAGPAVSIAGAVACQVASLRLMPVHADLGFALALIGQAQLALGLIDLVPAPPLDGGRVVVALAARRLGEARAERLSARLGRGLAAVVALGGVLTSNVVPVTLAAVLWAGAERTAPQEGEPTRGAPQRAE